MNKEYKRLHIGHIEVHSKESQVITPPVDATAVIHYYSCLSKKV